jgi:hypothetical protein
LGALFDEANWNRRIRIRQRLRARSQLVMIARRKRNPGMAGLLCCVSGIVGVKFHQGGEPAPLAETGEPASELAMAK